MAAEAPGLGAAYTAGFMGASPPDLPHWATDRAAIRGMFDRVLAGLSEHGETSIVGTWEMVDLAILQDGRRVPTVTFNHHPNGWIMTFLADGRLIVEGRMYTEMNGMSAGTKTRGAWFTGDGGRTLTLKMGDEHPAKCRVGDRGEASFWMQCPSRHTPNIVTAFQLQRLSR